MKALTWQGVSDVRIEEVPDPAIEDPTDIIVRMLEPMIRMQSECCRAC